MSTKLRSIFMVAIGAAATLALSANINSEIIPLENLGESIEGNWKLRDGAGFVFESGIIYHWSSGKTFAEYTTLDSGRLRFRRIVDSSSGTDLVVDVDFDGKRMNWKRINGETIIWWIKE